MDKEKLNIIPSGEGMLELVKRRQSDRNYTGQPIEKEKLERILEAGRLAPSACNASRGNSLWLTTLYFLKACQMLLRETSPE